MIADDDRHILDRQAPHSALGLLFLARHPHVPIAVLVGAHKDVDEAGAKAGEPSPDIAIIDNHSVGPRVASHIDELEDTLCVVLCAEER